MFKTSPQLRLEIPPDDRQGGDIRRLAPEGLPLVLDVEDTPRQSTLGYTAHLVRHRKPPSQIWGTFLENHVKSLVPVDFFTVLAHDRRRMPHFGVTAHPTAEWTAQQLREVFV